MYSTQRVHVGIWDILRAQRGSHTPTLRPKYMPYSYMDPLGQAGGFSVEGLGFLGLGFIGSRA